MTLWQKVLDQRLNLAGQEGAEGEATLARGGGRDAEGRGTGQGPSVEEETAAWREQLLGGLTHAAAGVGLPIAAAAIYGAYAGGRPILIPFWVAAYAALVLPLAWSRMPYRQHATAFVGVLLGVGLLSFFQPGFHGDGMLFFLCGTALATVVLGSREGITSLLVAFAAQLVLSWAGHVGLMGSPVSAPGSGGALSWWWSGSIFLLFLGAGLILAVTQLGQRLTGSLERCESLRQDLADRQDELLSRELDVERQGSRLKTVEELGRLTAFQLDPERVLREVEEAVLNHVPGHSVNLFMLEEREGTLKLRRTAGGTGGVASPETSTLDVGGATIVGWVAEHQEPYLARDDQGGGRQSPLPHSPETVSEAAVPLVVGADLLGVLDVQAREAAAFDEADLRFLSILANWAALAFENQRHLSDAHLTMDPLYAASSRLSVAATEREVLTAITDLVGETRAGTCLVTEFSRGLDQGIDSLICLRVWRQDGRTVLQPGTHLPLASSPFPVDLLQGSWLIPDLESDERLSERARQLFQQMGVGALASIPLRGRKQVFGQVLALYANAGRFSECTRQLYELLEDQAGLALQRGQRMDDLYLRARREELASKTAVRMHESLDVQSVLDKAVRDIGETLGLAGVRVELGPVTALEERTAPVAGDGDGARSQNRNGEEE